MDSNSTRKKMSMGMKILTGLTAAAVLVLVLWRFAGSIAASRGMSCRMWVQETGAVTLFLVLPLLLLLLLWKGLTRGFRMKEGWGRNLLAVGLASLYLFWAFFAGLFLLLGFQEERRLVGDLLLSNEASFLGEDIWVYYRRRGIFFREPAELEDGDRQRYLEEKYGCSFRALEKKDAYGRALFAEEAHPKTEVTVRREGWELRDNYVEAITGYYLLEGYSKLGLVRPAEISHGFGGPYCYLFLADEEDIEAFSEDAYRLLQYVTSQTAFYEEHRGVLYFLHMEGEQRMTGSIPFGKPGVYDTQEKDYWTKPEGIAAYVAECYQEGAEHAARQQEYQASLKAAMHEERGDGEEAAMIQAEVERQIEEEGRVNSQADAARRVYEEVLEEQGYSYEVCYNVKGNLYIDLGEGPDVPEDADTETFQVCRLVYDRRSKNDACELFVLYREHYRKTETGASLENTEFLNFYAVEIAGGRVIAADKTGWDELGTEAYREATGE